MIIGNHDPDLGAGQAAGRICQFTALDSPGTRGPGTARRAAICGKLRHDGRPRCAAREYTAAASVARANAAWPCRSPWRHRSPRRPCRGPAVRCMRTRDGPPVLPSGDDDWRLSADIAEGDRLITVQHSRGWGLPSHDFAEQEPWHTTIIVAGRHRALSSRYHRGHRGAATRRAPSAPCGTSRHKHIFSEEKVNS